MSKGYEKLRRCYESIRRQTAFQPKLAVVLGSGLGDFAETIRVTDTVEYSAIDGFPTSTVQGHRGRFVFGYVGAVPVVVMQGRVHRHDACNDHDDGAHHGDDRAMDLL